MAVFLRYLHPKNEQAPWKIDSEFTLKLSNSSGKSVTKTGSDIWNSYDALGFCDVFEWDSLLKDYLIDDVIIIEVAVKIKNMSGIPKKKLKSFERSNEEFSDVILAVGDKKFFVLRKVCSQFFYQSIIDFFFSSWLPTLHISRLCCSEILQKLTNQKSNSRTSIPPIFRISWKFGMENMLLMVRNSKYFYKINPQKLEF